MSELAPVLVQTLKVHRSDVNCCDFSSGGLLATGSGDKTVRIWKWRTGLGYVEAEYTPLRGHKYGVTNLAFSPQGTMLASCSIDGTTRVYTSRDGVCTHVFSQSSGNGVRSVKFSPDSGFLATGADDGSICLWDLLQKHLVRAVLHHEGAVQSLAFSPDSALLISSCTFGILKIFAMEDLTDSTLTDVTSLAFVDHAHDLGVLSIDVARDIMDDELDASEKRVWVSTGGQDQLVRLWTVSWRKLDKGGGARSVQLEASHVMSGHSSAVTCVRFRPDGELIGSASVDKTVRLWLLSGLCARVLDAHSRYVNCIAFSQNGEILATGSNDKQVKIWCLKDGTVTLDSELAKPCTVLSHFGSGDLEGITPAEGAMAALAGSRGEVLRLMLDADTHQGAVNGVCFDGDHVLATACSDKFVRLFRWSDLDCDLEELEQSPLSGHSYQVASVDFNAAGDGLLSCSLDGSAILWDTETGQRKLSMPVGFVSGTGGGGGGRAGRFARAGAPLALLGGDDAVAPLYLLDSTSQEPVLVYSGHSDAITCCDFTPDGHFAVTASNNGDFRLYRTPPSCEDQDAVDPALSEYIFIQDDAHDLGVQSCEFSPAPDLIPVSAEQNENYHVNLLATCGNDSLGKIWNILIPKEAEANQNSIISKPWRVLAGHGGTVTCIRFSPGKGEVVCTAATDMQARIWCVVSGRCLHVASHSSGVASCAISSARLLATGCIDGTLALWRLPQSTVQTDSTGENYRTNTKLLAHWTPRDVGAWVVDNSTTGTNNAEEIQFIKAILDRVQELNVDGAYLMANSDEDILAELVVENSTNAQLVENLEQELQWLKCRKPPASSRSPDEELPHHFLCPITHQLMLDPVKCSDGFTYERRAIYEWFLSGGKLISPMTNQPLFNHVVTPNFELKRSIRQYLHELG